MRIVLDDFGLFLGRKRNRFCVRGKDFEREFVSSEVDEIHFSCPGVGVSVSAINLALNNNTLMVLSRRDGWPYGFIIPSKMSGTVRGKREQFLAYNDERGIYLAKAFASGKMSNQANLLKLLWKNRSRVEPEVAEELYAASRQIDSLTSSLTGVEGSRVDDVRVDVMNREAEAAKIYWTAIARIVPRELGFPGRVTRGAVDPFNAMLNYGYKAILFVEVWKAIYYAGLDPYAGFLHADRPGKPSLALDLMEEFRPQVVDRALLSMLALSMVRLEGVVEVLEGRPRLSTDVVKTIQEQVSKQLDDRVQYEDEKVPMRNVIMNQARRVASYLVNPGRGYRAFELRW